MGTIRKHITSTSNWLASCAVGAALCGCASADRVDRIEGRYETREQADGSIEAVLPANDDAWRVQEEDDYCWAACVQTVLALERSGSIPTQDQLWARNVANSRSWMGSRERDAATFQEIRFALAPELREQFSGYLILDLTDSTGPRDLSAELARGQPVIVGLRENKSSRLGHAYVAYGMRYRVAAELDARASYEQASDWVGRVYSNLSGGGNTASGAPEERTQFELLEVLLFDPERPEYGGGHMRLAFPDVSERLDFAVSPMLAREFLEKQLALIRKDNKGPGVYVRLTEDGSLSSATVGGLLGE